MLILPGLRAAKRSYISSPQTDTAIRSDVEQGTSGLIDVLVRRTTGEPGLAVLTADMMVVVGSMHAVYRLARL